MRKPEVFKMACLRDIQRLFGPSASGHFYAGFGNRITDALSYRSVNIPSSRIFTIDSSGEVKMELLELAGYKSSYVFCLDSCGSLLYFNLDLDSRYIHMTDLVDQMFPPVHRNVTAEYTDFNFWRAPIQEFELPDLTPIPVSPALSARSDTSRLSRLRNFSLRNRGSATSLGEKDKMAAVTATIIANAKANGNGNGTANGHAHVRQSSPLASPVLGPDGMSDDEYDDGGHSRSRRRDRRLSMPGSIDERMLDDEGFGESDNEEAIGDDDDEDEDGEHEDQDHDDLEDPEATFDDDILATGEMNNIPFL